MWYRLILSAVRQVGKGGEYTIHKTKTPGIRNPIFTMSGELKDPTSVQGAGSKVYGEGHYTSQNPVVSYGYNFPYTRVEKLPYGTRIFDHDDISPELFNKILVSAGKTDPSLRATSNKTMADLLNAGIPYTQINKILVSLDFDAVEYNAFQNMNPVYSRLSESVKDLLIDHFIKFDKNNLFGDNTPDQDLMDEYLAEMESTFDSVLRFLNLNLDKISGSEKQTITNIYNLSVIGETKSLSKNEKDYLNDLHEFKDRILEQYFDLKDQIDVYYKDKKVNITEKKINSALRQLSKKNILIINSVVLTNPKLFQRERFRPETLTDEEKEYLQKKKYSTSYDVSKELVSNAIKRYGKDWAEESGLKIKLSDLLKLVNDNIISIDELDTALENINEDDFFALLELSEIPIEKYIDKVNARSFHIDPLKIYEKLMNLQDKELAKKVIPLLIEKRLIRACNIDTGIKLINMGLIDIDLFLKLSSRMYISNFNQLETLINFGISFDKISDIYNWNDYEINESADKYEQLGISQSSILLNIKIKGVKKLLDYGFDPNIIIENGSLFMMSMDDYQKMLIVYSDVSNLLKAGGDERAILDSLGILLYGKYKYIDLKLDLYKKLSPLIRDKDYLFERIFDPMQLQIAYNTLSKINERSEEKIELPNVDFDVAGYESLKVSLKKMDRWLDESLICPRCENILFEDSGLRCSVCVKVISYNQLSFSTNLRHETKPAMLNDLIPTLEIVRSHPDLRHYVSDLLSMVNNNIKQTLVSTYYGLEDKYIFKPFFENELVRALLPTFYEMYDSIYPLLEEPDISLDSDSDENDISLLEPDEEN